MVQQVKNCFVPSNYFDPTSEFIVKVAEYFSAVLQSLEKTMKVVLANEVQLKNAANQLETAIVFFRCCYSNRYLVPSVDYKESDLLKLIKLESLKSTYIMDENIFIFKK